MSNAQWKPYGEQLAPEAMPLQRAVLGEEVRDEELELIFDDGGRTYMLVNATPLREGDGAIRQTVAVIPLSFLRRPPVCLILPVRFSSLTRGRTLKTERFRSFATSSAVAPPGYWANCDSTAARILLAVLPMASAACSEGPDTLKPGASG